MPADDSALRYSRPDVIFGKDSRGPDSEEKREPVSDIDTALVDSLMCLTPDGRLERRTSGPRF